MDSQLRQDAALPAATDTLGLVFDSSITLFNPCNPDANQTIGTYPIRNRGRAPKADLQKAVVNPKRGNVA